MSDGLLLECRDSDVMVCHTNYTAILKALLSTAFKITKPVALEWKRKVVSSPEALTLQVMMPVNQAKSLLVLNAIDMLTL